MTRPVQCLAPSWGNPLSTSANDWSAKSFASWSAFSIRVTCEWGPSSSRSLRPTIPGARRASMIKEREREREMWKLLMISEKLLWHILAWQNVITTWVIACSLRVNSIVLIWAPFLRHKYLESGEAMWSCRQSLHLCECIFTMFKKIKMYQHMIKHTQARLMHVNALFNT